MICSSTNCRTITSIAFCSSVFSSNGVCTAMTASLQPRFGPGGRGHQVPKGEGWRMIRRRGLLTVALAAGALWPAAAGAATGGGETGSVSVDRGTNLAVTMSPDRRTIVMDLQGVLWRLPAGGGAARRLTGNFADPALPRFSPDGTRIAFQSYADGNYHVWTMRPDGSGRRELTSGPYDDREPAWSPDGRRIAFSSDRAGSYDIWVLDVASGRLTRWTAGPDQESQPTWAPDGREIAYVVGTPPTGPRPIGQLVTLTSQTIEAADAAGNTRALVTEPAGTISSPAWGPGTDRIAYVLATPNASTLKVSGQAVTTGEDVFPFPPQWLSGARLLYSADGKIRVRDLGAATARDVPFTARLRFDRPAYRLKPHDFDSRRARPVRGVVAPALSPD